jgi:nucleoside-diphosphate-sugar epimerase
MTDAKVLLIGGAGFLGSHVARELAARGANVTSLSRTHRSALEGVESLIADRRDPRSLSRVLNGRRFDFTVDLAAYGAADVESLLLVPYAALGRYALISSGQVYLVTQDAQPPFREEHSDRAVIPEPAAGTYEHSNWAYGVGKRRAEGALLAIRQSYGMRAHVLRIPILQGAGDTSLRLWAWIERLLDGGPIVIPNGGTMPVRHLHAADAARLLARWLEAPPPREAVYNFAPIESITLRELVEIAASVAGVEPRFVSASFEELAAAGIPARALPYTSRWASVLDSARAIAEFAILPQAVREYLPEVVRAHLSNRPSASDEGYSLRAAELEFARDRVGA